MLEQRGPSTVQTGAAHGTLTVVRVSRELPDDLVRWLTRARKLEDLAQTREQELNTVAATSALMLATADAGWRIVDIAKVVGMAPGTASRRIREARRRRGDAPAGLIVDQPPEIRGVLAELDTPVEDREWLSRSEAADYLGVAPRTVQDLFTDGLLPNSRTLTGTWRVYLRADLDRVRNGPRRGVYLDRAALRAQLVAAERNLLG